MQWLPYPKSAPSKSGWYLATVKRGFKNSCLGVNTYYYCETTCNGWLINNKIEKVVAFMEIPEPYEKNK